MQMQGQPMPGQGKPTPFHTFINHNGWRKTLRLAQSRTLTPRLVSNNSNIMSYDTDDRCVPYCRNRPLSF